MAATAATTRAERWGRLFGASAAAWAEIEERQLPTYEEALRRTRLGAGQRVLEVGCGTGVFLRAAADRGAAVAGLDASEALLELARRRVPEADLRRGDLQRLPHADDSFDLVAGFNAFFFADDMVEALREAGRVARPGGTVLIQVWGRPERCDLTAQKRSLARFLPPPAPSPPLWDAAVLAGLASAAGLSPRAAFETSWAYDFPDEETTTRCLLSVGNAVAAVEAAGEAPVRKAVVEAIAPYRRADGGYRFENEWRFLIASSS